MSNPRAFVAGVAASAALLVPALAGAQAVTLDFEGLTSQASINDFYNGGTDSAGASGTNYGVAFGSNALALTESDPGANFSAQPSGDTVMFFLTGTAVLNYTAGFDTGFSFYFSTTGFTGQVNVYDGLNATGNLLGSITLPALGTGPDAANPFSNWQVGSLSFAGMAMSIDFGGTVNQVGYDNITFGSVDPTTPPTTPTTPPTTPIPEPSTYALMTLGLVALAATARRRRRTD